MPEVFSFYVFFMYLEFCRLLNASVQLPVLSHLSFPQRTGPYWHIPKIVLSLACYFSKDILFCNHWHKSREGGQMPGRRLPNQLLLSLDNIGQIFQWPNPIYSKDRILSNGFLPYSGPEGFQGKLCFYIIILTWSGKVCVPHHVTNRTDHGGHKHHKVTLAHAGISLMTF